VEESYTSITLRELWDGFNPLGVDRGTFLIFRGYIDESYDPKDQNLFVLSCLMTTGSNWSKFVHAWKRQLATTNRNLKKQGRPPITRYHASACSGCRDEFRGWSRDERDDFVKELFAILKRTPMHTVAFQVSLDELCEVWPDQETDRLRGAYAILTRFLLDTIGHDCSQFRGDTKLTLFHDRTAGNGKYDPTILEAFNHRMNDKHFPHRSIFTSITAFGWEDCVALQPADLVAFEYFKQAEAQADARKSRKSFDALLNLPDFGIHQRVFSKTAMLKLRDVLEAQKRSLTLSS
jgi:hypothetical protein